MTAREILRAAEVQKLLRLHDKVCREIRRVRRGKKPDQFFASVNPVLLRDSVEQQLADAIAALKA